MDGERHIIRSAADGHGKHLIDVYAHNAVTEVFKKGREAVREERGRFVLPSSFTDELLVRLERWILDHGPEEAQRLVRQAIAAFLDERERLKQEDDERKVRARLPRS